MAFPGRAAAPEDPQGVITARIYTDLGGGTVVGDLTNSVKFPDSPDLVRYEPYFELWATGDINTAPAADVMNNFGAQLVGYFYPETTGDYVFYISADDNARLFLSTDDNPANKRLIAMETAWSNQREYDVSSGSSDLSAKRSDTFVDTEWPDGNTITLQAGQAYYIEAIVKEGGGGDNLSVSIDGFTPIPGDRLSSFDRASGPATIVTQPQSATVVEGESVTFSVEAGGTPPYTYQWTRNGQDIPDATNSVYTIQRVPFADNGANFAVEVTGAEGSVTSANATLTVTPDTTPPTLVRVTPSESFTDLIVQFSEPVGPSAETAGNYSLSGGLTISGVTRIDDSTVRLTTSEQAEGETYTLTINGVQDTAGTPNPIAANTTLEFRTFVWTPGVALHKYWTGITQNNIAGLTNDVRFPNNPTFATTEPALEYPPNGGNEGGSTYGNQLIAWITPPETGDYIFFVNSDDPSVLFLSTDDNPANKHLIAAETVWSNAREWVTSGGGSDLSAKRSDSYFETGWPDGNTITLQAGQRYYIEALHTEGGGGDNVGVAWVLPGGVDPEPGDPPIGAEFIGAYLDPNGASVTFTQQPANVTILQNRVAELSAVVTATSAYGTNAALQWQTAPSGSTTFTNIPGATSATFTTPTLDVAQSGVMYRLIASVPTLSATSSVATVTVEADTLPPAISTVSQPSPTSLLVSFDEPLEEASAETAANYTISGGVTVSSATLGADGTTVLLEVGGLTEGQSYTLTVGGVRDLFNNAVPAGTTFNFGANVVTYDEIILQDGPIAYYRFEETSGSVAVNIGTREGDGVYYTGDEFAPGEGGTESEAKGDPGPRPPEFLGFSSDNRAATFGGIDTQDWVDTRMQLLNGLGAFTLEYWVKPADRANQGTRIGIVGQNDAIEYGFIDPNTIQIWTPNGGSLNTAYSFDDNEWHHVATIADGSSLKTYYDGELVGEVAASTGNYGTSIYNVHIGGGGVFDAAGNYFLGQIDEVAIFDKAIPAERVRAHYLAGRTGIVEDGGGNGGDDVGPLQVTATAGNITISWPEGQAATLESATSVAGPWTAVAGATNPYQTTPADQMRFFRLRGQ